MDQTPVIDDWQIEQLTQDTVIGPYREDYRRLPIKDNGELLVSCSSFGLVSKDYYLNKLVDGEMSFLPALEKKLFSPVAWLRQTVAESLRQVDEELRRHDLFLVVVSGWRHRDVQRLAIEWAKKVYGEEETIRRYANVDPAQPQAVVPHETGGACDLELWSAQLNRPLSRMEEGDEISLYRWEKAEDLSEEKRAKREVRRLLHHVVCTPEVCLPEEKIFLAHPGEFWHFGYGDPLTAYFRHEPYAIYGRTRPPKGADMYVW